MKRLILLLVLALSACQSSKPIPTSLPAMQPTEAISTGVPAEPLPPSAQSATTSPPKILVLPSPMPWLSSTPDLGGYKQYTIDFLRGRTYGGGNIEVVEKLAETDLFTRYLIRYPSDGLNIYGFANIPKGAGPFPVIVALHGYIDPAIYQTLDYTTSALDYLTQTGYIVIHPNMRGYPPSDTGDNLFRVGMAVDVLNLLALIKSQSGPPELFAAASDEIGLWAHSMGGSIALRVLTVSSDVKAAVLFSSLSGNESKNSVLLSQTSSDPIYQTELNAPRNVFKYISPMYYYQYITAPIQLHHGSVDQTVPVAWAEETCTAMKTAGVQIECIYYPTEDHTFRSRVAEQVTSAMLGFYQAHLSP